MEHIKSQSQGLVTTDREHGHEESDINIKAIVGFALFLAVGGLVAHVSLWGMYVYLDKMAEKRNAGSMTPVQMQMQAQRPQSTEAKPPGKEGEKHAETSKEVLQRLEATFPSPRLQDDDVRDMNMLRANEEKSLNHYVWLDKNTGAVRIPVSRAMELIAERGLPSVANETPQTKPAAKPAAPAK